MMIVMMTALLLPTEVTPVLFSASSLCLFLCEHDNSWTAGLSMMTFGMTMYLDNL